VWIDQGRVRERGGSAAIVERYLAGVMMGRGEFRVEADSPAATADARARLRRVSITDQHGSVSDHLPLDEPVRVEVEYELGTRMESVRVGFRLIGSDGSVVFTSTDMDRGDAPAARGPGAYVSACMIPGHLLNAGRYFVTVGCERPMQEVLFVAEHVVSFTVALADGSGEGAPDDRAGVVRPLLSWTVAPVSDPVAPRGR
jgi:hypothetical protein